MEARRKDGLYLLAIGCLIFVLGGFVLGLTMDWSMADFKALYFSASCAQHGGDPYNHLEVLSSVRRDGAKLDENTVYGTMAARNVYLPTQFLFTMPLASLGYEPSRLLWMTLNVASLCVAAILIWKQTAGCSPVMAGGLIAFLLANSETVVALGNAAGIAVGLCSIAVWCFMTDRHPRIGVACLALSLMLKPQDSLLVWLFFFLAGGSSRKRALQTVYLLLGLSLPIITWITVISPHWMKEWTANLAFFSAQGGINDPGPTSILWPPSIVNLQSVISLIDNNPAIYNLVAYLLCAAILVPWLVITLRSKPSRARASFGIAAASALAMLATYHRRNDARLLLLSIPACGLLWHRGGIRGRLALAITSCALLFTGDNPWIVSLLLLRHLGGHHPALAATLQAPVGIMPAPLSMLAMGAFYVWAYTKTSNDEFTSTAA